MERLEVIALLGRAKAIWQDLAADKAVVDTWEELLRSLEYRDCAMALKERAQAGAERPSLAQIYAESVRIRDRRLDDEIARRKKIEYRQSDEERAAGRAKLREIAESIGRKL